MYPKDKQIKRPMELVQKNISIIHIGEPLLPHTHRTSKREGPADRIT
uniref:Uncharacterized protein n=1 Tax=Rhizophora mucronata TaxID=61149 RepID=A0A2P2IK92_RHIMU